MRHCRHAIISAIIVLLCTAQLASAQSYKGVNLAGAAFSPDVIPGVYGQNYVFPSTDEVTYFTAKGMNIFRISILWERLQSSLNGPLDPDELTWLKAFITTANSHHAAVIIDIHNYGRYRNIPIGQTPVSNAAFADLWFRLAKIFGQNNSILFGLMNEPQLPHIDAWGSAVQQAIAAIRKAGAGNQILVSGTQWDSAAGFPTVSGPSMLALQDPEHRLLFEVHQYFDTDSSGTQAGCIVPAEAVQRLIPFTSWLRKNRQHGFLGEFGVSPQPQCLAVLASIISYMKINADVWSGWTYWAAGPFWGNYMFSIEPDPVETHPQMMVLEKYLSALNP